MCSEDESYSNRYRQQGGHVEVHYGAGSRTEFPGQANAAL